MCSQHDQSSRGEYLCFLLSTVSIPEHVSVSSGNLRWYAGYSILLRIWQSSSLKIFAENTGENIFLAVQAYFLILKSLYIFLYYLSNAFVKISSDCKL